MQHTNNKAIRRLPSDHYFEVVQTEDEFRRFINSGMGYVWEEHCPHCWAEHLELKEAWERNRENDGN
jgi:hypothetical protein